ncbi:TetR family transcriptional regulator [Roseococcus sp.]|uniref:TetR/AcrR family transcriptional regulator n=1 Tax=Roseococcus sp. TaxID=2109646 RepID=UPI003BAC0459
MENSARSERTRNAAIQAALTIIARDGPGRLTLDAIAREGGLSKGALMHQFRTKEAVLKALLEYQNDYLEKFSEHYLATTGVGKSEPQLSAQIETMREATTNPITVASAFLGVVAEDPALFAKVREIDAQKVELLKAEAADPDLATLRWAAARGLAVTAMLGFCPLSEEVRTRLFDRLLDSERWPAPAKAGKTVSDRKRAKG